MKRSTFELSLTFLFGKFPLPRRTSLGITQAVAMWPRAKLWMNSDIFAFFFSFHRWVNHINTSQRIFNPLAGNKSDNRYAWTLIRFTVVFTTRNPAKTHRPRRTTLNGHACFEWRDIYLTVSGDRSDLSWSPYYALSIRSFWMRVIWVIVKEGHFS